MKVSKVNKLLGVMDALELGDSFKIRQYVSDNWDRFDYFTKRSFDVTLCNTKKMMPSKKFKVDTIKITRIL
jgi:hypothetical protein